MGFLITRIIVVLVIYGLLIGGIVLDNIPMILTAIALILSPEVQGN